MYHFTPIAALIGGGLIGLAASLFLLTHGRVAGISGIFGGLLRATTEDRGTRLAFIGGLLAGGVALRVLLPSVFEASSTPLPIALIAGGIVGFGTQLGSGCTSGHGVCGISRLSIRSIVATCAFMLTGSLTVFVARHLLGGAR